jgi:cell division protein FtsI (penicillin-binding protein 3)
MERGIEWAYKDYLNGKDGKILKQKIAKGQWKPIRDVNEVDPQDFDVISTIDVYSRYCSSCFIEAVTGEGCHGCVVVMETKTGHVKAISNLGRGADGTSTQKPPITQ